MPSQKARRPVWFETSVVKPDGTRKTWKVSNEAAGASLQRQIAPIANAARTSMWEWEVAESKRKAELLAHVAQHDCVKRVDQIDPKTQQILIPGHPELPCVQRAQLSVTNIPPSIPEMPWLEGGLSEKQSNASKK